MKPACSWCKDYSKYYENVQLRILIQNYKKLCGLIKITRLWNVIENQGDQGLDIIDIVRESEGEKLKNIKRRLHNKNIEPEKPVEVKQEKQIEAEKIEDNYEVEPPDEIISSPVSKLSIFKNNSDLKQVDNIRVSIIVGLMFALLRIRFSILKILYFSFM